MEDLNSNLGPKGKPYSYKHIQGGYRGGFFKYCRGQTPIMKFDVVKDFLALVFCRLQQETT